jgi:hypothetical protein
LSGAEDSGRGCCSIGLSEELHSPFVQEFGFESPTRGPSPRETLPRVPRIGACHEGRPSIRSVTVALDLTWWRCVELHPLCQTANETRDLFGSASAITPELPGPGDIAERGIMHR